MEDIAASLCKASNHHYIAADLTCSMPTIKSVGSIDNFKCSFAVVCRMLFGYCMEVMWNAVFYDNVKECSSSWRKKKLWSGYPLFRTPGQYGNSVKKLDNLPDNVVSYNVASGFIVQLLFAC